LPFEGQGLIAKTGHTNICFIEEILLASIPTCTHAEVRITFEGKSNMKYMAKPLKIGIHRIGLSTQLS
jgi:hypothetical protein